MKKYNYIYKITNLVNGKIYIGKHSTDRMDDGYMGSGVVLHQAYKKYGLENFKKEVILFYNGIDELNRGEIYWIAKFNSTDPKIGYNLTYGGDGGMPTDEIRSKLSEARKGVPLSEEHRRKVGEGHKGVPLSEEHRRKISEGHKGVKLSEETKRKISEANKISLKGKHLNEEHRRNLSEATKLYWQKRKLAKLNQQTDD